MLSRHSLATHFPLLILRRTFKASGHLPYLMPQISLSHGSADGCLGKISELLLLPSDQAALGGTLGSATSWRSSLSRHIISGETYVYSESHAASVCYLFSPFGLVIAHRHSKRLTNLPVSSIAPSEFLQPPCSL